MSASIYLACATHGCETVVDAGHAGLPVDTVRRLAVSVDGWRCDASGDFCPVHA